MLPCMLCVCACGISRFLDHDVLQGFRRQWHVNHYSAMFGTPSARHSSMPPYQPRYAQHKDLCSNRFALQEMCSRRPLMGQKPHQLLTDQSGALLLSQLQASHRPTMRASPEAQQCLFYNTCRALWPHKCLSYNTFRALGSQRIGFTTLSTPWGPKVCVLYHIPRPELPKCLFYYTLCALGSRCVCLITHSAPWAPKRLSYNTFRALSPEHGYCVRLNGMCLGLRFPNVVLRLDGFYLCRNGVCSVRS
jgi:hypothetical protein